MKDHFYIHIPSKNEQTEQSFMRALGFTDTGDGQSVRPLLEYIIKNASVLLEGPDNDLGLPCMEWHVEFVDGFGLAVYGTMFIDEQGRHFCVEDWTLTAENDTLTAVADFYVDSGTDTRLYAYCEEYVTGSELEFRLTNHNDHNRYYKETEKDELLCVNGVYLAAFASGGTVILPVEKTEETLAEREEEESIHRDVLARARRGDESAAHEWDELAQQMNAAIEERLLEEDYLTVFESYLMPIEDNSGVYAMLGEIEDVCAGQNKASGETVVQMTVDVTGMKIKVAVNQNDLVGLPSAGMRLMAVVYMVGKAGFIETPPTAGTKADEEGANG